MRLSPVQRLSLCRLGGARQWYRRQNTIIDTGDGTMQIGGSRVRDTSKVCKADPTLILKSRATLVWLN